MTRAALRWLVERRIVLAAGLAASLPIIVSAVHAVSVGWYPMGDDAYVAVRAFDVTTDRSPLVGQWSFGATSVTDELTYSPGPLLFWLLALPARLLGPASLAVTMALVNVLCIIGVVGLARRRGGPALMWVTAVAVPVMLASLPEDTYTDVWNSSVALMPVTLLMFLAWSVAAGEYRLLPLLVLVASFSAQAHLAYVAPVVTVTGAALVGLLVARRLVASRERPGGGDRRALGRWVLAALAVALVCWSAPLVDQAIHRPGNLVLLGEAATGEERTVGWRVGGRALVRTVGLVPWWLREPSNPLLRIAELTRVAGTVTVATALLVLVALLAVALLGVRRRRADLVAAGGVGLAICLAVAGDARSTPADAIATADYTLRWAAPAGMVVYLMLGWSVATLLAPGRRAVALGGPRVASAGLAVAAVAGIVVAVSAEPEPEPFSEARAVNERLLAAVPPDEAVRVDVGRSDSPLGSNFQAGIVFGLRRELRPVTAPSTSQGLGEEYAGRAADRVVHISVDAPSPRGSRTIGRFRIREPFAYEPRVRTVTVALGAG